MGTLLYFCDLRGPPKPSLWTPWGSVYPRLRTYDLEDLFPNKEGQTEKGWNILLHTRVVKTLPLYRTLRNKIWLLNFPKVEKHLGIDPQQQQQQQT